MTHSEIARKLVGPIIPQGKTEVDNDRFDNLKAMCEMVNDLVTAIDYVAYNYGGSKAFSEKRAGEYAQDFLTNKLGIK